MQIKLSDRREPKQVVDLINQRLNKVDEALRAINVNVSVKGVDITPIFKLYTAINQFVVGMEKEVALTMIPLATGLPALLLGPPGTAKTLTVRLIGMLTDLSLGVFHGNKYMDDTEVAGPLDINALKSGQYKRVASQGMAGVEVVYLDETFRMSDAVKDMVLAITERTHEIDVFGIDPKDVKLLAIYGASNFIDKKEYNRAFTDRFSLFIHYVPVSKKFGGVSGELYSKILEARYLYWKFMEYREQGGVLKVHGIDGSYIRRLRSAVREVAFELSQDKDYTRLMASIFNALSGLGFEVSERKQVAINENIAGYMVISGQKSPTVSSIVDVVISSLPIDSYSDVEEVKAKLLKTGAIDVQTMESDVGSKIRQVIYTIYSDVENLRTAGKLSRDVMEQYIRYLKKYRDDLGKALADGKVGVFDYITLVSDINRVMEFLVNIYRDTSSVNLDDLF